MYVAAVIPAFNEEKTIGDVVRDVSRFLDACIVVDDGSADQTAARARAAGACVMVHLLNRGQGAALKTGNAAALASGADIIVHFDADGQHRAEDIPRLVGPIARGEADVVFGSRFLSKTSENNLPTGDPPKADKTIGRGDLRTTSYVPLSSRLPFSKRYLLLPLARIINRVATGIWLTDAHNGLRALSRHATEHISITQDRMAHNTEIPAHVCRTGLRFIEVPVSVRYREYGQGVSGGMAILRDLVLERFL